MKRLLIASACSVMLLLAEGCVTDNGKFPEPTANFMPKRTYAVQYDKLWQATLDALDKNQITVVSTDKSDGIIQTDYVAGPGTLIMLTAQSTRFKFNLTERKGPNGIIKLSIICKIEDSMNNGHESTQWRDVTPQNVALATKLETWLYEQIEDELKAS